MHKKNFFVMLICLALTFALSQSTASTAQAPEPMATPEISGKKCGRRLVSHHRRDSR
jgi:hypothetical protein